MMYEIYENLYEAYLEAKEAADEEEAEQPLPQKRGLTAS